MNTFICPLEKFDPYNRINSWFTVSYSIETTDSFLPMTLPIVMTSTPSVKSIVACCGSPGPLGAANYEKQ